MPFFSKYLTSFLHENNSSPVMFIMIGMDFFFQENHYTEVWILDTFYYIRQRVSFKS